MISAATVAPPGSKRATLGSSAVSSWVAAESYTAFVSAAMRLRASTREKFISGR